MGITGLLPILASKLKKRHISAYKSQRIGIDGHAWLYQILPCVAEDLFFNLSTRKHIHMFEAKLRALVQQGIIPVVVLDGDVLVSKCRTNERRRLRKEKSRKEAEYWLMQNNPTKAKIFMKQCMSVTSEIISALTTMLQKMDVEYIISPYESDAQLCYLQRTKYIDCILTEDSDLIAYGADKILYKFDNIFVHEFNRECLEEAKDKSFMEKILDISILSGCDYLDSIQGVGVVTAHKLLLKEKTVEGVVEHLKLRRSVPSNYLEDFAKAKKTFLHQIVYDPIQKKRRYLEETKENLEFLGTLENGKYKVVDSQQKPFFMQTNQVRLLQRHFIPEAQKYEFKEPLGKRTDEKNKLCVEIDTHLHSPYFSK